MIIAKVLYVLGIITFTYLLVKTKRDPEVDENIKFISVAQEIDEMNSTKEQLAAIEEMITEISICSPDDHNKFIRCEWANILGERFNYDLFIDGNGGITNELLKIAYSERKRLRVLLRQQIKNLNDRCNENCNENHDI